MFFPVFVTNVDILKTLFKGGAKSCIASAIWKCFQLIGMQIADNMSDTK